MKKRKLPKKPRSNASLTVWESYERKLKEVEAYNRQLEADKKKKEALKKQFAALKKKNPKAKVKAPKATSSLPTWQNAMDRLKEKVKDLARAEADKKKKDALIKKFTDLKRKSGIKSVKAPKKTSNLATWQNAMGRLQQAVSIKKKTNAIIGRCK